MGRFKRLGLLVAALLLPLYGLAHVRLIHPSNGLPLFWAVPSNIEIVVSSIGSDNISDGSEEIALRMAIEEWNAASGTSARLVENTSPAAQARTDWHGPGGGPNDIHLVYFDEVNASGYFPQGSSTVAITPVFFFGNGKIADADILYNGGGWDFSTSAEVGHFDVGDVGAHEIGHLLGLNHSAFMGSTMYPYVDPSVLLHRSISVDEARGLRDAYPSGGYGRISGTVLRMSNLFPVPGAYVVATDANGRTAASLMTDTAGNFSLPGMDPGTYTVSAVPLGSSADFGDAPVDSGNLGGGYFIATDFEPAVYGSSLAALFYFVAGPYSSSDGVSAGTAIRLEVSELAYNASLIVEGRVLSAQTVEIEGLVATEYLIEVGETLAGTDLAYRTVCVPGGVREDGSGMLLAGMPMVLPGDTSLFFLTEESSNGLRMPVGLAQGKFDIVLLADGSKRLVRDASDVTLINPQTGTVQSSGGRAVYDYAQVL